MGRSPYFTCIVCRQRRLRWMPHQLVCTAPACRRKKAIARARGKA